MNSSAADIEPKCTIIQKVIVLGDNPALMAGFVNRASGLNTVYHLYAALGVGIGIARTRTTDQNEVVMQLWLIPNSERVRGINEQFRRGYSGAIIVVNNADVMNLSSPLESLKKDTLKSCLIVVVGSQEVADRAQQIALRYFDAIEEYTSRVRIDNIVGEFGNALYDHYKGQEATTMIIRLDEDQCPEYHHMQVHSNIPECTPEGIELIKSISKRMGLVVDEADIIIDHSVGLFRVDFRSGDVRFTPAFCDHCIHDCIRNSNICIVGIDRGWSSEEVDDRALLIVAKIYALAEDNLPQHVKRQIRIALQCRNYSPIKDAFNAPLSESYSGRISLLEEAAQRVSTRRLSVSTFELLKKRLQHIRSREEQYG